METYVLLCHEWLQCVYKAVTDLLQVKESMASALTDVSSTSIRAAIYSYVRNL